MGGFRATLTRVSRGWRINGGWNSSRDSEILVVRTNSMEIRHSLVDTGRGKDNARENVST